ncbi:MAG: PadR family transcriptional regulator [Pseudomonadota bacterium]
MDIKHIILGMIEIKPMTGYEIKQLFDKSFTFFSGASYGSIYPALKKLEENGLITLTLEVQDGKPNRKIYTIKEKGRAVYLESLLTPLKPTKLKNDLLTRLFFFSNVPEGKRLQLIDEQIEMMEKKHGFLQELEPFVLESADEFQLLCYQYGIDLLIRNIIGMKSIKQKIRNLPGQGK